MKTLIGKTSDTAEIKEVIFDDSVIIRKSNELYLLTKFNLDIKKLSKDDKLLIIETIKENIK